MSARNNPHPVTSLPFVFDYPRKPRHDPPRSFWHVQPTGDYVEDCRTGRRFALELLAHQRADLSGLGGATFLARIVSEMPRGKLTGIEIGFLQTIGYAASFGLRQAEERNADLVVYPKEGAS